LRRLGVFVRASLRVLLTDADVVHCITGSSLNLIANAMPLLAARLSGKPSVLSIAGSDLPQIIEGGAWFQRLLFSQILSWPTRVIACNTENEAALKHLQVPGERILVMSNALPIHENDKTVDPGLPPELEEFARSHQPLLLSISARYYHYGSLELIQALAGLATAFPKAGLVLIFKQGHDPAFVSEFDAFVHEHRLADRILVLINVPAVFPLMYRVEVFVRTPRADGDSISVREALTVGLPVVASATGYRPEGTLLFKPGDSADLQAKLSQVLSNTAPRTHWLDSLDDEGRRNLERLLSLYRELVRP
jgi:glycosyltransferase involved in cell wall biosynthesis